MVSITSPLQQTIRVLVIEDSTTDFELLQLQLRRSLGKIEAVRVENEVEMRTALDQEKWDLILSDHNLPQFGSRRALEVLQEIGRDIPFLIVSGMIGENHAVEAMLAGADDYVMKGNLSRLIPAIERALRAAGQRQEKRQAEQALQLSLERLETLVSAAPLAIVLVDRDDRLTVWNSAAEKLLGMPAEQVLGQILTRAQEPLLRELNLLYQQLKETGTLTNFSALLERPDGTLADISVTAAPLSRYNSHNINSQQNSGLTDINYPVSDYPTLNTDNNPNIIKSRQGMVAFITDITEQRRIELAQRESETRLEAITANLPGAVFQMLFHLGERSVLVPYVSEGVRQLFGLSSQDFTSQPFIFSSLIALEDRDSFHETLSVAATHQETFRWQGQFFLPQEKEPRWLYFAASPRPLVMDYSVWDGIIIDITQQKAAEQQLQLSQEELRALTAHMETVKETERADIAREIHDDLGGTLTKLKADVIALKKWLIQPDQSRLDPNQRLDDMLHSLEHTVTATSRIARALRPAVLDLGLIPALEWEIAEFHRRHHIPVSFVCNVEELALESQPSTTLYRVVQEALTNCLKHAQATQIDVELFVTEDQITLEIRDNGVGLAPHALRKVNSFGVRGMSERARMLGGWLDISGAPQKGTTIMLSIPRHTSR